MQILYWDTRSRDAALVISAPTDWPCGMLTALLYRAAGEAGPGGGQIVGGYEDGSVIGVDLRRPE